MVIYFSLSLSLFSRACIRVPFLLVPFIFLTPCLGRVLWLWQCLFYFPVPCWAIPLGCWQCLFIFPTLCDSIMHDVCVYVCVCVCVCARLCVCGWSCTLNDGLSWLHEQPSLAMSALDLVTWVCDQGICCRCIFMSYCVHSHRGVTVPIHVTKWHWFPHVCDTYQCA